jgi:F0F1-type ATP synthase assembly protein I
VWLTLFENIKNMIKGLALALTLFGIAGLILGVIGIFGRNYTMFSPWALAILGIIFFSSGIGLLKSRSKDPDV